MRSLVGFVALLGCGRLRFDEVGAVIDAPVAPACTSFGAWSMPTRIGALSSTSDDYAASLRSDGLEVMFESARGGNSDLWRAARSDTSSSWSTPTNVSELNTPSNEEAPTISGDGLTVYFVSDRGAAPQLYRATRSQLTSQFGTATPVAELSTVRMAGPELSFDGSELVYGLGNPSGLEHATWSGTQFVVAGPISELNVSDDGFPTLTADGLTIFWERNLGTFADIYTATRASKTAPFTGVTTIPEIDTPSFNEVDSEISADGTTMIFSSDRGGAGVDFYSSTRTCL